MSSRSVTRSQTASRRKPPLTLLSLPTEILYQIYFFVRDPVHTTGFEHKQHDSSNKTLVHAAIKPIRATTAFLLTNTLIYHNLVPLHWAKATLVFIDAIDFANDFLRTASDPAIRNMRHVRHVMDVEHSPYCADTSPKRYEPIHYRHGVICKLKRLSEIMSIYNKDFGRLNTFEIQFLPGSSYQYWFASLTISRSIAQCNTKAVWDFVDCKHFGQFDKMIKKASKGPLKNHGLRMEMISTELPWPPACGLSVNRLDLIWSRA